jgi:hypothetical protein
MAVTWKRLAYYEEVTGRKPYHGIETIGSVSFNASSHIVTIATGVTYWVNGVQKSVVGSVTSDIDSYESLTTNTLYYFYFDDTTGTLKCSDSFWNLHTMVPACTVFWNGSAGAINKEWHNYTRDIDWHINAHLTIGTRYHTGLSLTCPNTVQDSVLTIETGDIYDEDLLQTTGQCSNCRGWYKTSANVYTFANYSLPYLSDTSGAPQYLRTTDYTLQYASTSKYICCWVYASTDIDRPIYIIPTHATAEHNTITLARAEAPPNLSGLNLNPEMKLIYKFIYKGDGEFQEYVDYRNSSSLPAGGNVSTSAGAVSFVPYGNISSTTVQGAIQELDDEKKSYTKLPFFDSSGTAKNITLTI